MLTTDHKRKLVSAVMFALPVMLVLATGLLLGGPNVVLGDSAGSGTTPAPLIPKIRERAPMTSEIRAAAEHIARLADEPFGPTPLYYRADEQTSPTTRNPELQPAPDFVVRAILSTGSGNTALIAGEPCRVGDELPGTEWIIVSIDRRSRSVTIEDPETGRTVTRSVER